MTEKTWGGKSAQQWVERLNDKTNDDRGYAASYLAEMVFHGLIESDAEQYRVAVAVAKATHDESEVVRNRSYGTINVLARWYAFDLRRGRNERVSQTALRRIIHECNRLPLDLLLTVPDVIDAMKRDQDVNESDFDFLIYKLKDEVKHATGEYRVAAEQALKLAEESKLQS